MPREMTMSPRRRTALLPLAVLFLTVLPARADEGEWPPEALASLGEARWKELAGRGVAVTARDLWDGSGGGLLSAVLALDGCTGAFVSEEGLFLTNHHCAFSAIQLAST